MKDNNPTKKSVDTKQWWQKEWLWILGASLIFLVTRLISLRVLPVFADEAIYIRWSQLIMTDPEQYLFFPLNDGKTPLQMWLMVPFLMLSKDPLWGGRLLSVLVGLVQMWVMYLIVGELLSKKGASEKEKKWTRWAQLASLGVSIVMPFWFFHQRMALTDALLSLCLALVFWCGVKVIKSEQWLSGWLVGGILALGGGFYTKLPAMLFIPTLALLAFWKKESSWRGYLINLVKMGLVALGGGMVFLTLKLNPAFSQLFTRGGDFLLGQGEIMELGLSGIWRDFGVHLKEVGEIMGKYVGWGLVGVMGVAAILRPQNRRTYLILFLSALSLVLPIALLGKVIYHRYYLPMCLPLGIMGAMAIIDLWRVCQEEKKAKWKNWFAKIGLIVVGGEMIWLMISFMMPSWTNTSKINFTRADKYQYLYSWSAGDGTDEVVTLLTQEAKKKKILVLTEGYFGTLPDGLLMNLYGKNVENIFVEGIGAPVHEIPEEMKVKMADYDETWLVVNDERLELKAEDMEKSELLLEKCRAHESDRAPVCLQVWQI